MWNGKLIFLKRKIIGPTLRIDSSMTSPSSAVIHLSEDGWHHLHFTNLLIKAGMHKKKVQAILGFELGSSKQLIYLIG